MEVRWEKNLDSKKQKNLIIEQVHEVFKIESNGKAKAMLDKYLKENPE